MTRQKRPTRPQRPGPPFVPLHLQSHFSLLHGTASIADLATWLEAEGIETAALVDRNNVYGAVFWHAAMARLRKRAITGAEVDGAFAAGRTRSDPEGRLDRLGRSDPEGRLDRSGGPTPFSSAASRARSPERVRDEPENSARSSGEIAPGGRGGETKSDLPPGTFGSGSSRGAGPRSPEPHWPPSQGEGRRGSGLRESSVGATTWTEGRHRHASAVLLARDFAGYENVCRVVSARQLDESFDLVEAIAEDARGLFVLVRDPALAAALRPHLAPGALWMEVSLWTGPRVLALQRETARALGIGLAAGGALAMRTGEDVAHQRVLAAIRTNGVASEMRPEDLADPEGYLRPAGELTALLAREAPEALANAHAIAEACTLELLRDKPIFPDYPLGPDETAYSRLHHLTHEGLRARYGSAITPAITERLDRELQIIHKTGFSEYFLVVGDLVKYARENRIPVVGRGSGASSIVAYILGITSVDPIRYRLYFERFLNSLRDDWPDLDVDICWRGRDDVIDYAYERYGRDRVAMISTHNHYHPRSAFRDVARAFGIPTDTVNRVSKRMPRETGDTIPALFERSKLLGEYPRGQEPYRSVLQFAESLRGAPRHLGIHCGGIVIGDRPLARLTGLEEATKGLVVTQYEMDSVEQIGLIKIDLLGNRAISTIRETLALVRERRGEDVDMDAIPHDDARTSDLLANGRTLGCFQIESPGMRNLLRMIGTKNMGKTIAAHSLIRPGPASSGMKEAYVKRVRGMEKTRFKHPALGALIGDLLEDTFGVPLYEEDVMAVASRVTGISLEEGDLLRRRIGEAKDEEKMRALTHTFLALAVQRGVDIGIAKEVWRLIARFASYSFCRAHAAGYGVLAYQTAWLKANYPVEHAVSLLNNHQGMYPTRVHFEEARRRGIPILLPCVQKSGDEFELEEIGGGSGRGEDSRGENRGRPSGSCHGGPLPGLGRLGRGPRPPHHPLGATEAYPKEIRPGADDTRSLPASTSFPAKAGGTEAAKDSAPSSLSSSLHSARGAQGDSRPSSSSPTSPSSAPGGATDGAPRTEPAEVWGCPSRQDPARPGGTAVSPFDAGIRVGLGFVRDLSHVVRERIYAERPFRSLGHFLRRVAPPRRDAENLILIGAFDWTGLPRTELLWELYAKYDGRRALRAKEKRARFESGAGSRGPACDALFTDEELHPEDAVGAGGVGAGGAAGDVGAERAGDAGRAVGTGERRMVLTDFSLEEKLHHELRILGLAISAHPIALIRGSDRCRGAIDSRTFHESAAPRSRVVFVGVRDAWRTTPTKKGDIMMFLTLEDEHDLVECTLFPKVYRRYAEVTRLPGPFRVTGRVDEQYGVKTITVDRLEAFGVDAGLMEALSGR